MSLSLQNGASTYWFLVQYQLVGNWDGDEYGQGLPNEMAPFSLTCMQELKLIFIDKEAGHIIGSMCKNGTFLTRAPYYAPERSIIIIMILT